MPAAAQSPQMTADDQRTSMERLDAALSALEGAVGRIAAAERSRTDLVDTLAVMDEDRQRLTDDLDAALARARTLETANEAVEQRLQAVDRRLSDLLSGLAGDAGGS